MELNKIYQGDSLEVLKQIPDEFVDMVITSPPYYGLRNYGVDGQIGLEETFDEFLKKILLITAEIKRVLKPTGSFWLNMGDCYGAGQRKSNVQDSLGNKDIPEDSRVQGFEKCMLMQPERLAIAMIDQQGWILRNKIKWAKQVLIKKQNRTIGSVMPSSVKDRFNESGEELYFFVKNKKYYFNLDEVRMPAQTSDDYIRDRDNSKLNNTPGRSKMSGLKTNNFNYRVRDSVRKDGQPQFKASKEEIDKYTSDYGRKKLKNLSNEEKAGLNRWMSATPNVSYQKSKGLPANYLGPTGTDHNKLNNPAGKNLPTIWQIGSEPHNFQKELQVDTDHFAIFPQALVEIPIKAGSPPGGVVLDPFSGSGTVALVARSLGRNYIGIELNEKYIKLAEKRLNQEILL